MATWAEIKAQRAKEKPSGQPATKVLTWAEIKTSRGIKPSQRELTITGQKQKAAVGEQLNQSRIAEPAAPPKSTYVKSAPVLRPLNVRTEDASSVAAIVEKSKPPSLALLNPSRIGESTSNTPNTHNTHSTPGTPVLRPFSVRTEPANTPVPAKKTGATGPNTNAEFKAWNPDTITGVDSIPVNPVEKAAGVVKSGLYGIGTGGGGPEVSRLVEKLLFDWNKQAGYKTPDSWDANAKARQAAAMYDWKEHAIGDALSLAPPTLREQMTDVKTPGKLETGAENIGNIIGYIGKMATFGEVLGAATGIGQGSAFLARLGLSAATGASAGASTAYGEGEDLAGVVKRAGLDALFMLAGGVAGEAVGGLVGKAVQTSPLKNTIVGKAGQTLAHGAAFGVGGQVAQNVASGKKPFEGAGNSAVAMMMFEFIPQIGGLLKSKQQGGEFLAKATKEFSDIGTRKYSALKDTNTIEQKVNIYDSIMKDITYMEDVLKKGIFTGQAKNVKDLQSAVYLLKAQMEREVGFLRDTTKTSQGIGVASTDIVPIEVQRPSAPETGFPANPAQPIPATPLSPLEKQVADLTAKRDASQSPAIKAIWDGRLAKAQNELNAIQPTQAQAVAETVAQAEPIQNTQAQDVAEIVRTAEPVAPTVKKSLIVEPVVSNTTTIPVADTSKTIPTTQTTNGKAITEPEPTANSIPEQDVQSNPKQIAIDRYVENITKDVTSRNPGRYEGDNLVELKTAYKGIANKLVTAIENKDFKALHSSLHLGNKHSLTMFTEITGLPTKLQRDTDASIRSLDPGKYDAWVKTTEEARQAKATAETDAKTQREFSDLESKRIRQTNGKIVTNKEYIQSLFEEGYVYPEDVKKGTNTELHLFAKDEKGNRYVTFRTKVEREYIRSKLTEYQTQKGQVPPVAEAPAPEPVVSPDAAVPSTASSPNQVEIERINGIIKTASANGANDSLLSEMKNQVAKLEQTDAVPADPIHAKLSELDKKISSLIDVVSGNMEMKGSAQNVEEQPVQGKQHEVASSGSPSSEGSTVVRPTSGIREAGQSGGDNGKAGRVGSEPDGVRDVEAPAVPDGRSGQSKPGVQRATGSTGSNLSGTGEHSRRVNSRNYRITAGDILFEGGKKTRFKNNVSAIRILKQVESENRIATPEEQKTLLKYVGWGGVSEAFDKTYDRMTRKYSGSRPDWISEYNDLREILTPEEYEASARSTQNAHYTHPDIINAMYAMAKRLGFKGGTILEPSVGTGHFIGLLPDDFLSSRVLAVEKDSITGRIAKLLYPDSDIRVSGFEDVQIPNNYFDLAISNVPFGDIRIYDDNYKAGYITSRIHNYFFVKALDKVKPGGAVMFITSTGTLNARDEIGQSIRRHIAAMADLVAAFRLPGDAFKENAGTEVTTDIIILRKRIPGEIQHGPEFENVAPVEVVGKDGEPKDLFTNEYFTSHPENVLGNTTEDKLWPGRMAVVNDGHFMERLKQAITDLPSGVFNPIRGTIEELTPEQDATEMESVKNNSFFIKNGELHQKHGNMSVKIEGSHVGKMTALVNIKESAKAILAAQIRDVSDAELSSLQVVLSKKYDAFVKQNGHITDKTNARVLKDDPENYLLKALELFNTKTGRVEKSGIFTKRSVHRYQKPETANSPDAAIAITLYETGRLDISRVSDLLGVTDEEAGKALAGYAYKNPAGSWETSDEYLSGNVRQKLQEAKDAAQLDSQYKSNIDALENVQPEDIKAVDIDVKMGASWLPTEIMKQFTTDLLETRRDSIEVTYNRTAGTWSFNDDPSSKRAYQNTTKYGAYGWSAVKLIEHISNMKQPIYKYEDADGHVIIDQEKTAALKAKADEIREVFSDWVWKDLTRRNLLENAYNTTFNAIRNRTYVGVDRKYPGMDEASVLYPHQREGVERIVYGGNTLLAHGVGFGKTRIMVTGAMELKRLGIASKPMLVVPNTKLADFQNEYKAIYPNAKVLAASEDDFKPENIRNLFSQIATNEWDAIIVRHSSFTSIPTSKATKEAYIREQIDEVELAIIESVGTGHQNDKKVTKQLEKVKDNLIVKLKSLDTLKKVDLLTLEEMGIDYLFVDEAHEFKNLRTYTKLQNVKGLNTQGGPTTEDFYSKARYVSQLHGGKRGLVFATGTPISNSLNELYTMFKYLRPDILRDAGVQHFDAWMSTFGNVENRTEIKHDGRFKPTDRFRSFVNVEELMSMFKEFADIRMDKDDIHLDLPEKEGGKPIVNESPPHPEFKKFAKTIIDRMNNLPRKPGKGEDNALSIAGDARRATTDMRLINPAYADSPDSKINRAVKNAIAIYKSTKERKATQMIFLGEGRSHDEIGGKKVVSFDGYNDIRSKLIKAGIPPEEVVLADRYKTKEQKDQLYNDINSGKIRVIIGSYALMGTGINIQERLFAIHEIDVPWRPSDVEQSEGRMVRQGNLHMEWGIPVQIHRYIVASEGSFDAFMWQLQESKLVGQQKFYKGGVRRVDVEENADVEMVRQMKAMATGNPLVIKKVELESKLIGLRGQKKSHQRAVMESEDRIAKIPGEISANKRYIAAMEKDLQRRIIPKGEEFTVKIGNKKFTDKKQAATALKSAIDTSISRELLGEYAGFNIMSQERKGIGEDIILRGETDYGAYLSSVGEGMFASINNSLNSIEARITAAQKRIETINKEMADRKADVGTPFAKEAELLKLSNELHDVNAEMEKQYEKQDTGVVDVDEDTVPEQFMGDEPPEVDLASEGGFIRLPGKTPHPRKAVYKFADERLEAQHTAARLRLPTLIEKIAGWSTTFAHQVSRTYALINPRIEAHSYFLQKMNQYPKLKSMAGGEASRMLRDILQHEGAKLTQEEFNVFERWILLRDLMQEIKIEHTLPGLWTPDAVNAYYTEIESSELTPNIKAAVVRRDKYIETAKNAYIAAMKLVGVDVSHRFKKENYFRHQVLEYAQAKLLNSKKGHVAKARGWGKERHGSNMGINEDYLQAEYEVLSSMILDTNVAKLLSEIGEHYDIKPELKKKAKAARDAALDAIIAKETAEDKGEMVKVKDEEGESEDVFMSETELVLRKFRQKIAIGLSNLRKMAEEGSLWDKDGKWSREVDSILEDSGGAEEGTHLFQYLADLMNEKQPGAEYAGSIFKAISQRREWLKELLGSSYKTWEDMIPTGYAEFQPVLGKHFYSANAITDKLVSQLLSGHLAEIGIDSIKIQKVLVQGTNFKSFVVPEEYPLTLEKQTAEVKDAAIENVIGYTMKNWKRWQLHRNPWRLVKYNIRNLSGDADKLMGAAGISSFAPKYVGKAVKELFDAMKWQRFTPDMLDFRNLGGFQDNLYVQEIAAINDLGIFKEYDARHKSVISKVAGIPKTWDEFSSNLTEYRENILRYAAYLYYLDDLKANNGKPSFYGASLKERINGLDDNKEKAYQLSKEALGAYDEVSEFGRWFRKYMFPFWSFKETNLRGYIHIVDNILRDDEITMKAGENAKRTLWIGVKMSTKAIKKLGSIALRVAFLTLALQLWNNLVMKDADDDLPESVRDNPHITLGRKPNGDVIYFSRLGSVSDVLEWFNLSNIAGDLQDIANGYETTSDVLKGIVQAPINILVNGLAPYFKIPMELLSGKQYYPDAFKPGSIRDTGDYFATQFGLEQEFDRIAGRPVKESYLESWSNALVYSADPEQSAYYAILDLKNKYRRNVLKEFPTQAFNESPKSKALYYFKLSMKYGDAPTAGKYLKEYLANGGTVDGLETSLASLSPLYGMSAIEQVGFYTWLRPEDRQSLKKAYQYYIDTLGGAQ